MAEFWRGKSIVVTGGAGFLGSAVVDALRAAGADQVFVPRSRDYDLRDREGVVRMLNDARPELLFHLAATAGGIGANKASPGRFFYDNAIMGIQVIEEARKFGVGKTLVAGTICSYPKYTHVPFREDDLWNGYPEETNAPYGLAKKMLMVQAQAYREEYGMNVVYVLPTNLYGPRDNFDLETSHVIPAVIRKFVDARDNNTGEVTLWGTGKPTREFLYVDDAAQGLLLAMQSYDNPEPVNLGAWEEVSISDLALMIRDVVGFGGKIAWDPSKPDGQPRRRIDTSRAQREFGFVGETSLRDGLEKTVAWYQRNLVGSVRGN